jgi:hypothetical protein
MMLHSKTEKESKKRHGPVMCACQLVVRKQYQPKALDICGVPLSMASAHYLMSLYPPTTRFSWMGFQVQFEEHK